MLKYKMEVLIDMLAESGEWPVLRTVLCARHADVLVN